MIFTVKTRKGLVGYASHTHRVERGWLIVSPLCNPGWATSKFPPESWLCVKV